MQSPMGTQEKGILMSGVDSCIVKDQCSIIAEFGKKPAQTADGGLLVRACVVTLNITFQLLT